MWNFLPPTINKLLEIFPFFFFWVVWAFELISLALCLQSRHSITWATPLAHFSYFLKKGFCLCLNRPGPRSSYLCFLSRWDDRYIPPCLTFYWLGWDLVNFLPGLVPNHDPPCPVWPGILEPPASASLSLQNAGITGLHHQTHLIFGNFTGSIWK
jgi:hypothetical protein